MIGLNPGCLLKSFLLQDKNSLGKTINFLNMQKKKNIFIFTTIYYISTDAVFVAFLISTLILPGSVPRSLVQGWKNP